MDQKPGLDNLNRDAYSIDDILAEYTRAETAPSAPVPAEVPDADRTQVFNTSAAADESASDADRTRRFERPTADQVRDYVAAFRRGEAQPRSRHEQELNPGFFMGGDRGKHGFRYGGKELDLSAEADYVPRTSRSEVIPSYAPEKDEDSEDDETPDAPPKFGFLDKLKKRFENTAFVGKQKAEADDAVTRYPAPQPDELVLPGEQIDAEAAPAVSSGRHSAGKAGRHDAWRPSAEDELPESESEPTDDRAAAEAETVEPLSDPYADLQPDFVSGAHPAADVTPRVADSAEEMAPAVEARQDEEPFPPSAAAAEDEPQPDEPAEKAPQSSPRDDDESAIRPAWSKRMAAESAPYASVFPDTSAGPAVYAEDDDYDEKPLTGGGKKRTQKADEFPRTFKDYVTGLIVGTFYGFRRGLQNTLVAEEDDEDLGKEVEPGAASKYYGSFLRAQRMRLRICGILLLAQGWISLGLPVTAKLNSTPVASLFCLILQLAIMLLCLDVVTGGVLNAVRGKFGADFAAVLACTVTGLDALLSALPGFGTAHLPLCFLSSLSMTGVLLASWTSCRGLRKALRVPSIGKRAYTLAGETDTQNGAVTLLKSARPVSGFVRRCEEAAPDETLFEKLTLPLLGLTLLLTVVVAIAKQNASDLMYILSVLICPTVPFMALMSFALPFYMGSVRLFRSGAAVAGWSGASDIGVSKNLVITDRDLFPEGTISFGRIRIDNRRFTDGDIISYAGSLIMAGGGALSEPFAALMQRNGCATRTIENFAILPGGFSGVIDYQRVLCGGSELMRLMNVPMVGSKLAGTTAVYLAVKNPERDRYELKGIFNLEYTADEGVSRALHGIMRTARHPVFAIRDFNVTPALLHELFDVATDGYDFPPFEERFPLSEERTDADSHIAAVVCLDGLGPLSHAVDTGRSIYVSTRVNLWITAIGAVLGVLMCFARLLAQGGVSVGWLFVVMLIFAVPVMLIGLMQRYFDF